MHYTYAYAHANLKKKSVIYIKSIIIIHKYIQIQILIYRFTCHMRWFLRRDPEWIYAMGGGLTGFSILLESKHRHYELLLWVAPRVLQIILRLFEKEKWPKIYQLLRSDYYSFACLQLTLAAWMILYNMENAKKATNSLNFTALTVVFGSQH